jgi:hypothetical protein
LKENLGSQYLDKNVTVIEGEEGYKLYIEGRLRCKNKLIRDLSGRISGSSFFDDYDSYMKGYISRRVKVGIWLNQLVPYGEMDDKWDRSSKEMYKEARELPKGFEPNAVMSTWDDKSAFISKEGKSIIGFVVKDRLITAMMNSMFDFLWERVKN